jgi:uncharacterized protein YbaA (DUF1428 family)
MGYVDGFVIPIPKKNLPAYTKLARKASKIWMEHGALEYRECVGDDLECPGTLPFPKLAALKPGETVVFSWIVYKSRAHRDRVNAKIMADPRIVEMMQDQKPPFDPNRMAYGGFKMFVNA